MPQKCCISGCRNSRWKRRKPNKEITYQTFPNEGKEITFHYFPKDEEVNRRWKYHINLCTKQENVGKNQVICSAHFNESDVIKRKTNVILRNLAVPCVFPNMNYTDYEVLYYPDDKENVEPNAKKIKLDVESLKLKRCSYIMWTLLLATKYEISWSISINCSFDTGVYSYTGTAYICDGTILFGRNIETLTAVHGTHETGKNNTIVDGLKIEYQNMEFFPKNIKNIFPNIIGLYFPFNSITTINNDHLNSFPKLIVLYLYSNKITMLDSNLFSGMTNLRYINFEHNKIEHVGHDLLLSNSGDIYFGSNPCIDITAKNPDDVNKLKLSLLVKCPPTISQIEAVLESRGNLFKNCTEQIDDKMQRLIYRSHQLERRVEFLESKFEKAFDFRHYY